MSKVRVADYVVKRLVELGARHVFMVTGGGAMHLNDAFGRNKAIECIFNHHEQACAIAAEGYVRSCGKFCVVNVTAGPGGTNALTGVLGNWTDSVPVIYVSGQVKFETTIASCKQIPLRQLGDQESSIIDIVSPLTKYAIMVNNPLDIKKILNKAVSIATTGRPGPVWIDVPINIQGAVVDENDLREEVQFQQINFDFMNLKASLQNVVHDLLVSKRPLIVAGNGIRISGSQRLLDDLFHVLKVPVVTTFNGMDLLPNDNPLFVGRIGTIGQRAGNFALQNADLIFFLGTRNNIRQISYNWKMFAPKAKKVVVDIDDAELKKPTLVPDIPIHADVKAFLTELVFALRNSLLNRDWSSWLTWCQERNKRYPVVLPEYKTITPINPYFFIQVLTELLDPKSTVVCGNGSACVCTFQAGIVKKGQRIFWNSGCASMGYDLPAAIGACFAKQKSPIICIAGDGSLMMNLQELQTVKQYGLPIKLFVFNNGGYLSIKQTQSSFFGLPFIGCDKDSGISFPDFVKVAETFGIHGVRIQNHSEIKEKIMQVLSHNDPVLCEVILSQDYIFSPKLSSKRQPDGTITSPSLEDMYPFLSPEELKENMIA
jgi:acetolactate synthase I/II/III large subunit